MTKKNILTKNNRTKQEFAEYSPKERVLAAALKLFVEQGYFNTNIPDLSRESLCSVGSIYHIFKNKEDVAAELYREGLISIRSALYHSIEDKNDTEVILKTIVKSFLIFSAENLRLSKYMWLNRHNEFMSGSIHHPTKVGYDLLGRKLTKTIKDGIRTGELQNLKVEVIWSILFGIPISFIRDWLDGYSVHTPEELADDLANSCWRALKA